MSLLHLDPATALRVLGYLYLLMAIALWLLFGGKQAERGMVSWTLANLAAALGAWLFGARGVAPAWATTYAANLLVFTAYGLGVEALRSDVGLPPRRRQVAAAVLVISLAFVAADFHSDALRMATGAACHVLGAATMAYTGMRATRVSPMKSVQLISGAYWVYALTLALLLLSHLTIDQSPPSLFDSGTLALAAVMLAGMASGVFGTLGCIGMASERLYSQGIAQAAALASEGAQRNAAEHHAQQLQRWLEERDDLIRVLAHEVRQPLNNASAALQGARAALGPPVGAERRAQPPAVEDRLRRAQRVLGQVVASLDNTLAAAALLASPDRVAQQDADVDLLLQLSLGDIDSSQAWRVEVDRSSSTRTATMDPGLMRLALRNLLSNALTYSEPDSRVLLRVSDSDEPLALVFEVLDSGPGLDPELEGRLFKRGERGRHERSGHGLGLYVVQRVAQLHGGSVTVQPRPEGGSVFRLVLPQDRAA